MTISISNLTVNNNASLGTVVGVLTARDASGTVIPCNFTLTKNSAGFLAISGNNLVTAFSGSILAGNYSVRVHANGTNTRFSGNAVFNIRVNIAAPPPPPPPTLTLVVAPAMPTIPSSTPLGTTVATLQGVWSDRSPFTGSYAFVSPNYDADTYSISGSKLIVAPNGPGVGSAGGSVEHVTMEAVQIALTLDGVTSSAPTGSPLATSAGVWSWGPAQAGRHIGGGGFQGDYVLYLNGMQVASAFLIEVAHTGQLYANNSLFGWFVWNGTQFVSTSAP
jgi:hypothetical protein